MLKLRARHNKHQAIWLVEPGVKVGRSATNDMILDNDAVAPTHFVIGVREDRLVLKNRVPNKPLRVNDKTVEDRCRIGEGDLIVLGDLELEVIDPKKDADQHWPGVTEWSLKANSASMGGRVYHLKDTTLVGRSGECDIHLGAAHLSRRHAQLQIINGLLYVKDLGSSNGTFLNGRKITESRVRRGDELRFDTLRFGVIGPADDLGKTSVRSTATGPSATAKSQMARRAKTGETGPRPTAASADHFASEAVPASVPSEQSNEGRRRGWVGGLVLVMLAVAAVVVWLFRP